MVLSSPSSFPEIVSRRLLFAIRYMIADSCYLLSVISPMPLYSGFIQLGAGLSVGLAGLAAGFAIGIVGDAGVRGTAQQYVARVTLPAESVICTVKSDLRIYLLPNIQTASLRRYDSYPHFRRSIRSIRSYCCTCECCGMLPTSLNRLTKTGPHSCTDPQHPLKEQPRLLKIPLPYADIVPTA